MGAVVAGRRALEKRRIAYREPRSVERVRAHYAVEARLADQLRHSMRQDRATLYSELYRTLFAEVADHPQNHGDRDVRTDRVEAQVAMLRGMIRPDTTYVEIGCGDAVLTKALAPHVAEAIGIDVTSVLIDPSGMPPRFRFVPTGGIDLDLPDATADLVYSNQLMEHLHVDDARDQLREVFRILKPGGSYVCVTPNRLTGPHDISGYFGYTPAGFHLREYDHRSLRRMFREAGFRRVVALMTVKGRSVRASIAAVAPAEALLDLLPPPMRARLARGRLIGALAGVTVIGAK